MSKVKIKIGARKSVLAQIQAQRVASALIDSGADSSGVSDIEASFVGFTTQGDRIQDKHLRDLGGKELFVREVEQALLDGEIDCAVHSLKDLPAAQPAGVVLAAILPRGDCRDALVSAKGYKNLDELPQGARVGTASPRRSAQLQHSRKDLEVVLLRGNVDTRLKKIQRGELDAAILAHAGLERLGQTQNVNSLSVPLDVSAMLPAAAQGAICVECRADDERMRSLCRLINDAESQRLITAERSFSSSFGGSCHIPLAALAVKQEEKIILTAELLTLDGSHSFKGRFSGTDPRALGEEASLKIKELAGERLAEIIGK